MAECPDIELTECPDCGWGEPGRCFQAACPMDDRQAGGQAGGRADVSDGSDRSDGSCGGGPGLHFVWWTCLRDLESAVCSLRSVRRVERATGAVWTYTFAAAEDEIEDDAWRPWRDAGVHVEPTGLPRGRSLNTDPLCPVGMVDCMRRLTVGSPAGDYVIKIDSDVLMFGGRFLADLQAGGFEEYGTVRETHGRNRNGDVVVSYPYTLGMCYALRVGMLRRLPADEAEALRHLREIDAGRRHILSDPRARPGGITWPEDEAISLWVQSLCADPRRLGYRREGEPVNFLGSWPYGDWHDRVTPAGRRWCGLHDFVEFGSYSAMTRHWSAGADRCREARLRLMRELSGSDLSDGSDGSAEYQRPVVGCYSSAGAAVGLTP